MDSTQSRVLQHTQAIIEAVDLALQVRTFHREYDSHDCPELREALEERVRQLVGLPEVYLDSFTGFNPAFDGADLEAYGTGLINWVCENRGLISQAYDNVCHQRDMARAQQSLESSQGMEESPANITEKSAQANIDLDQIALESATRSLISIQEQLNSIVAMTPLLPPPPPEGAEDSESCKSVYGQRAVRLPSEEGEISESELARNLAEFRQCISSFKNSRDAFLFRLNQLDSDTRLHGQNGNRPGILNFDQFDLVKVMLANLCKEILSPMLKETYHQCSSEMSSFNHDITDKVEDILCATVSRIADIDKTMIGYDTLDSGVFPQNLD